MGHDSWAVRAPPRSLHPLCKERGELIGARGWSTWRCGCPGRTPNHLPSIMLASYRLLLILHPGELWVGISLWTHSQNVNVNADSSNFKGIK